MPARKSFLRRLLRWATAAILVWITLTVMMVLLLRFVPPLTSAFMLGRKFDAIVDGQKDFRIGYRWTPISKVPPVLKKKRHCRTISTMKLLRMIWFSINQSL